jgi:hypothetical protein
VGSFGSATGVTEPHHQVLKVDDLVAFLRPQ